MTTPLELWQQEELMRLRRELASEHDRAEREEANSARWVRYGISVERERDEARQIARLLLALAGPMWRYQRGMDRMDNWNKMCDAWAALSPALRKLVES